MRGMRSGVAALAAGILLGGLVVVPPVAGMTSPMARMPGAIAAVPSAVQSAVAPMASRKKPAVVFTSTLKLVVDVNPDLTGSKYWKLKLQRKSASKWKKVGTYRTQGAAETRAFAVKAGTYRVKVFARPGYKSLTTKAYRFVPTPPASTQTPAPPDTTAPGPVIGLAVTGRTATSITLSWTNPSDADLASVIVRRASAATAPASPTEGTGVGLPSATATSATDTGLAVNTAYSYAVFTRDVVGNTSPPVVTTSRTPPETVRVSVAPDGPGLIAAPAISADGRWVTYDSLAVNVVAGDTNAERDVFLYDAVSRTTQRVSVATGDIESNGWSGGAAISSDGRWVAYYSAASNLVAGDTNDGWDVFLFDRVGRTTQRVSMGTGEVQSDQGSWSFSPAISADGRWIIYTSDAANLVAGDTNDAWDVFLFDTIGRTTERVSVGTGGVQSDGPSTSGYISADGRWITYRSAASNLVDGDTNGVEDLYLFDTVTRATLRVSVGIGDVQANAASFAGGLSADGRWITYTSGASNLVAGDTNGAWDVFLYDTVGRTTSRVSVAAGDVQGNGASRGRAISSDGRWITYDSDAPNLVAGDTNGVADVFLFDTLSRTTQLVSVANDGLESNGGGSVNSAISGDGRWITFASNASNLVAGDTNGTGDVFLTRMW